MTDKVTNFSTLHGELPVDTLTAVHLLDLFRDPDHDIDRIVELISMDPVLTAETLRHCNNAVFGNGTKTTDLFEAVSRLGYYELYGIIAASIGGQMLDPNAPAGTTPELIQEHPGNLSKRW